MRNNTHTYDRNTILSIILIFIVSFLSRFYNYFDVPYTHDEISAILRTHYNSFGDLLKKGVLPDGHPPLIQVFLYYYIKLFGDTEWVVKLPFTLCGIGALVYIYLACKRLFSITASLIILSFVSTMKVMVQYSQIARPYITGLFFVCATFYYMILVIDSYNNKTLPHSSLHNKQRQIKNKAFFILFILLSALNHHLSFLTCLLMICLGGFFIRRNQLKRYIFLILISFILYVPNIPILFAQLKIGGLSWLGKPTWSFLFDFIKYIFPYSYITVCIIIILCCILYKKNYMADKKKFFICMASITIFFLSFIIPYLYSLLIAPIIQYSSLFFAIPFLLFFCFGIIKDIPSKYTLLIVICIMLINIASICQEKHYYTRFYNSIYKKVNQNMLLSKKTYSDITLMLNDGDNKIKFYADRLNIDLKHTDISAFNTPKKIYDFIRNNNSEYLYFGALYYENPIWENILCDYYPYISQINNYWFGSTKVFSKHKHENFQNVDTFYNRLIFQDTNTISIDSTMEYSPCIEINLKKYKIKNYDNIDISLEVQQSDTCNSLLVVEYFTYRKVLWQSQSCKDFTNSDNTWKKVYMTVIPPNSHLKNLFPQKIKVYIWNRNKETLKIKNLKIKIRNGNPIVYGVID